MNIRNSSFPSQSFRRESISLIVILASFLLLIAGQALPVAAQQISGSIAGTVKDLQGALISTATVRATNDATGFSRSAPVNGYGEFRIDYLPVGTYTVQVNASGFKRFVQKKVMINVDQTQVLQVVLEVGVQSETITVSTAPPLVNTSNAELGTTIEQSQVIGLPLVNRNAYAELSLTPGVMSNSASQQSNPSGTPNFNVGLPSTQVQINGSVDGSTPEVSFYLDGGYNVSGLREYGNQVPNPDALEEFRVETNDFSAEYGHMSGAVVTAVTKSGTNSFHGSLFEFNRNTDFNAYPWNAPKSATGQFINAPYHRNQFGGVVGGPIRKNKAFFFFSAAGLRQVVGQYESGGRVPTAAERLGDFTQDLPNPSNGGGKYSYYGSTPFTIKNPISGTTMTGQTNSGPGCASVGVNPSNPNNENCVPAASTGSVVGADPLALTLLSGKNASAFIPLPNVTPAGATVPLDWSGYFTGPTNETEYLGKFDESLTDKDHLAVMYFWVHTAQNAFGGGNIAPWTINQSYATQQNANISDVHSISATTANQTWLTFTRVAGGRVNLPAIDAGSLGSNYTIQGPSTLPDISVSGYFTLGDSIAGPVTTSDYYSLRDMVTMTKGKHTLIYGGESALDKCMAWSNLDNYGVFNFSSSAPTTTGNALSDFYTGMLSSMEQDTPFQTLTSAWHTAVFLQDNYRITPRFTASLGIRWDIDTAPVESRNHTATFVDSKAGLTAAGGSGGVESGVIPSAPAGMFFPGDSGVGRGIVSTKYRHISPRIGFAWDPWGDGKTAIRAGAGVFYGALAGNEWNQPGNANPYAIRQTFTSVHSASDPYNPKMVTGAPSAFPNGDPFPYIYSPSNPRFLLPASIETIGENVQWPYTYQFNLAIQRQLPGEISLTTAYVGTISRDVPTYLDNNYGPYVPGITNSTSQANENSRRPYDENSTGTGTLGQNIYLVSNQTANYHSLQVTAARPLTRSLMLNGYYVWSHALQSSNESAGGLMTAQDFDNLWEEKGAMSVDRRNVAVISGIWKIDYYHGTDFLIRQVVNGWTMSPIWTMQSGTPIEVTTGADQNFDTENHNRPDLVAGVSPSLSPHRSRAAEAGEWFNTAAYVYNGPGVAGGIGPGGADGDVRRDSYRAPGYRDVDLGLFRDFSLEHGMVLQLRGEATNAFNLVSLNGPASSGPPKTVGAAPASSTFGTITGAASPRIIQVGARFTF